MEKFKNLVDGLTQEWNEHQQQGRDVTCEFSTSSVDFEDKVDYLHNKKPRFGEWRIYRCETCKEHNPDQPWHVEIVDALSWDDQHQLMGKLRSDYLTMEQHTKAILEELENREYYPIGSLKEFVDLFECLVENPEQYDEYVRATLLADIKDIQGKYHDTSYWHKEQSEILEKIIHQNDPKVLCSQSVNVTIDKEGKSLGNWFSEINGGCVGHVNLRMFDHLIGKRLRVTIDVLDTD